MTSFLRYIFLSFIMLSAWACPKIGGLIDYNCDGKIVITFLGDSFVSGYGDNPRYLGYVGRFALVNPSITVNKIRKFGLTTPQLLKFVKSALVYKDEYFYKFQESDFILVDAGRNDRWLELEPSETASNVLRSARAIRDKSIKYRMTPFVAVARLPDTTRLLQRAFISSLNKTFDKFAKTVPILNFSKMPLSGLSYDQLHPNRDGYIYMYKTVDAYVHGRLQVLMTPKRIDADKDGLYDIPEFFRYGIKVGKIDTDSDGLSDVEEVFVYRTNPNIFDDINVVIPPVPSPTPTPEVTPTPEEIATPTPTPEESPTPTPVI